MIKEGVGFYMRKDEACRVLGVSRKVLTSMVDAGVLHACQLVEKGNHYLVREEVMGHVQAVKEKVFSK